MLSIHEEHMMYFPNHSMKEFRKVYESRISNAEKFLKKLMSESYLNVKTILDIKAKIDIDKSRLTILDQLVANGCDVKFTNVTQQLKDAGKI